MTYDTQKVTPETSIILYANYNWKIKNYYKKDTQKGIFD